MGSEEFGEPRDFNMSLEDFLLMRLELETGRSRSESKKMIEMEEGALIVVQQCLQLVKISSKHDELAEAYRKKILELEKINPAGIGFHKMFALTVFNKLAAEKKGEPVDWQYCNKLTPDSPFLEEEMARVWG